MVTEYAALQEHVKKVGGFDWAERLYASPLDSDGVVLPNTMKVCVSLPLQVVST